MGRFPFGIPNGWYLLSYSEDLEVGAVQNYHYVDRELVAYRGNDGVARLVDAYCPHLGAHLGFGGVVEGDGLRCPFHRWRFDGTGRCIEVPYANRLPTKARLRIFPTREVNGMIFFWFHAEGAPPTFEVPDCEEWHDEDFIKPWVRHEWTVRTHPQEMQENAVDSAHFPNVHRMDMEVDLAYEFRDNVLSWSLGASKEVTTLDGATDHLVMRSESWGLGYSLVRQEGRFRTLVVTGLTPIDGETTHMRLGVIGKRDGRSDAALAETLDAYMAEHAVLATEDFHIWEHKLYRPDPQLVDGDGAIAEFRRWAAQFYSPSERS